jgi:hypothetical protein
MQSHTSVHRLTLLEEIIIGSDDALKHATLLTAFNHAFQAEKLAKYLMTKGPFCESRGQKYLRFIDIPKILFEFVS